jgi:acyl dehydratase
MAIGPLDQLKDVDVIGRAGLADADAYAELVSTGLDPSKPKRVCREADNLSLSEHVEGSRTMKELYLEDIQVGQRFEGSTRIRIDRERIKSFAAEFDPQPFHLDEQAARNSVFGGLAASGWHTAAVTMRLLVDSEFKPAGGIIGAGFDEFRWPRPVRPGDELHVQSEVLEVRPSKSRPDQGLVKVKTTTLNQSGEPVLTFVGNLIVRARPKSE